MYEVLLLSLFVLPGVAGSEAIFGVPTNDDTWNFFDVYEGESFQYDICDHSFYDSYTAQRGRCYTIQFEIQNIVNANEKQFYFISSTITHNEESTDRLFLIDGTDNTIYHIFLQDRDYAKSLQNTLFWKNWGNAISTTHGASTINLQDDDDATTLIISDSIIAENGLNQYVAVYENFESSRFTINDGMPLPVSASIFTAGHTEDTVLPLFSFELLYYADNNIEGVQDDLPYPEIINSHYEVEWK